MVRYPILESWSALASSVGRRQAGLRRLRNSLTMRRMLRRVFSGLRWRVSWRLCVLLPLLALPVQALVNGRPVAEQRFVTEYPWAVTVVNALSGGICGGVLIEARWVLTAAHCAGGRRYVLVGSVERSAARRVEVERIHRHPDFSAASLQNDVALLFLAEPVELRYAGLPSSAQARLLLRRGAPARIIGWGKTEYSREPVDRLHEADVRLQNFSRAGSRYVYTHTAGPCGRDSGSPMQMRTLDGRWLIIGIASATDGNLCAQGGGRAVYTSIGGARQRLTGTEAKSDVSQSQQIIKQVRNELEEVLKILRR